MSLLCPSPVLVSVVAVITGGDVATGLHQLNSSCKCLDHKTERVKVTSAINSLHMQHLLPSVK